MASRSILQFAPRGFSIVADTLDRLASHLPEWAGKDVTALGVAAAMRTTLLELSGNSVRHRLAIALQRCRHATMHVRISSAEWESLQVAEPLLRPALRSSLASLSPLTTETSEAAFGGARQLLRDAELASASYRSATDDFCLEGGVEPEEIIAASWDTSIQALVPAYCLLLDPRFPAGLSPPRRRLVLVIRGTRQLGDALMDFAAAPERFLGGAAHSGVLHAAKALAVDVGPALARALVQFSGGDKPVDELCIVGHSLGGGASALLAMMLLAKQQHPNFVAREGELPAALPLVPACVKIRALAFCSPAIVSENLAIASRPWVSSILHGDDVIPRLNLRSAAALRQGLAGYDFVADLVDSLAAAYPAEVKPALARFISVSSAARALADADVSKRLASAALTASTALSSLASTTLQGLGLQKANGAAGSRVPSDIEGAAALQKALEVVQIIGASSLGVVATAVASAVKSAAPVFVQPSVFKQLQHFGDIVIGLQSAHPLRPLATFLLGALPSTPLAGNPSSPSLSKGTSPPAPAVVKSFTDDDASAFDNELGGREGSGTDPVLSDASGSYTRPASDGLSLHYYTPGKSFHVLWRSAWHKASALYPEIAAAMRADALAAGCPAPELRTLLGDLPLELLTLAAIGRVFEDSLPLSSSSLASTVAARAPSSAWPQDLPPRDRPLPGLSPPEACDTLRHLERLFRVRPSLPLYSAPFPPVSSSLAGSPPLDVIVAEVTTTGDTAGAYFDTAVLSPFMIRDHIARPTTASLRAWVAQFALTDTTMESNPQRTTRTGRSLARDPG
jgi:hypothetical protein